MKEVAVVFWSNSTGHSFKAPRLNKLLQGFENEKIPYAFYGIGKQGSIKSKNHHIFSTPLYVGAMTKRVLSPFGISSANRYIGTKLLSRLAQNKGSLSKDKSVIVTQPFFLDLAAKAKKQGFSVIIESDYCHPMYAWSKQRLFEKEAGVSRRKSDSYNFYPYAENAARTIQIADAVIVFSQFAKETFLENGVSNSKIALIKPELTQTENFDVDMPDIPTFVCTASQSVRKGSHVLLEAWDLFTKKHNSRARLVLIGERQKSLDGFRKYLDRADIIEVGHADIPDIYKKYAGCFIMSSILEGRPRAVLEAMACGMPAIVSEAATCDLVIEGYNGWRVQVTPESIAYRLNKVCEEWENIREYGRNAKRSIELDATKNDYSRSVIDLIKGFL